MAQISANQERLYNDVLFLTSLTPARNYRNEASLNKAAAYIYDELASLAFDEVGYQEFETSTGSSYKNVVALLKGKTRRRIVVGAHYDVWDEQPGADDNASAVAGLLETARLLTQQAQGRPLAYTLEFVSYCLEEPPFFATEEMGSYIHARSLHQQQIPLALMLCYEMIGYFSDAPGSQGFPHPSLKGLFPDAGNFIIVGGHSRQAGIARQVAGLIQPHCRVPVYPVASAITDSLVDLSDHRSYWKWGYPALMINDTSFLRNPHYHQKSDTIQTLDFERMAEVVKGVATALVELEANTF
jgi:Zn-dependent M28 family amino/carboxypeptidase